MIKKLFLLIKKIKNKLIAKYYIEIFDCGKNTIIVNNY